MSSNSLPSRNARVACQSRGANPALITYGSLLHEQQRAALLGPCPGVVPVMVRGYRRQFDQEPSWRQAAGQRRAVLNVTAVAEAQFNALLLPLASNEILETLDRRERGYDRIRVDPATISPRLPNDPRLPVFKPILMYVGKPELKNCCLLPNPSYLEICLAGADQWGEDFSTVFRRTTFVGHQSLDQFLASSSRFSS